MLANDLRNNTTQLAVTACPHFRVFHQNPLSFVYPLFSKHRVVDVNPLNTLSPWVCSRDCWAGSGNILSNIVSCARYSRSSFIISISCTCLDELRTANFLNEKLLALRIKDRLNNVKSDRKTLWRHKQHKAANDQSSYSTYFYCIKR